MRVVAKVDGQGYFVEDVLLEDGEPVPEGCIESRPQEGLHAPLWTGSGWVEGKPEGEIVEALKGAKVGEIAGAAINDLSGLFTEGRGRDETALLVASHVLSICRALNITPDARLAEVVATGEKALTLKAEVEGAGSVAEVKGVEWT